MNLERSGLFSRVILLLLSFPHLPSYLPQLLAPDPIEIFFFLDQKLVEPNSNFPLLLFHSTRTVPLSDPILPKQTFVGGYVDSEFIRGRSISIHE